MISELIHGDLCEDIRIRTRYRGRVWSARQVWTSGNPGPIVSLHLAAAFERRISQTKQPAGINSMLADVGSDDSGIPRPVTTMDRCDSFSSAICPARAVFTVRSEPVVFQDFAFLRVCEGRVAFPQADSSRLPGSTFGWLFSPRSETDAISRIVERAVHWN